jgi:hypothetical protein
VFYIRYTPSLKMPTWPNICMCHELSSSLGHFTNWTKNHPLRVVAAVVIDTCAPVSVFMLVAYRALTLHIKLDVDFNVGLGVFFCVLMWSVVLFSVLLCSFVFFCVLLCSFVFFCVLYVVMKQI